MSKGQRRRQLTNEEKLQLWRAQIGLEEESVCPGCLVMRVYRRRPTTWQVCHVEACSRGGTMQLYNVFIMCKLCNDAQATQNLYRYLHRTGNEKGLHALLAYVSRTLRHQYAELWEDCQGLMHVVAQRLLISEDVRNTGKLHPRDPVLRHFVRFDAERCRAAIEELEQRLCAERKKLEACRQQEHSLEGLPALSGRERATPPAYLSLGLKKDT